MKYKIAIIEHLLGQCDIDVKLDKNNEANKNRLKGKHFPEELEHNRRIDCVLFSNRNVKRIQTYYRCDICKVGLCIGKCFKDFHTKIYYK